MEPNDNVKKLAAAGSAPLIAIAAALDACEFEPITEKDLWKDYLELVSRIEKAYSSTDEPRFTLYDYLDALFNATYSWFPAIEDAGAGEWQKALALFREDEDAAFAILLDAAQAKRDTYQDR